MQIHHSPTKILIVGRSGVGKSTYQTRYVKTAKYDRYFIFDHKTEISKLVGCECLFSFEACAQALSRGLPHICYHYSREYPGESERAFQDFCYFAYSFCNELEEVKDGHAGNSLFVCDEVNRFTSTTDLGDDFKLLIEDGRLQGLDFIGTSHASNQISNRLRLQLSEIVAMKTTDSRPLIFLEECGFDVEEVRSLNKGEYILYDFDKSTFVRDKLFSCAKEDAGVDDEKQPVSSSNTDDYANRPSHKPSQPSLNNGSIPHASRDAHLLPRDSGVRQHD